MKRASEVPPPVLRIRLAAVISSIAAITRSVKAPGFYHEHVGVRRLPRDPALIPLPCRLRPMARFEQRRSDSWL